MAAKSEVASRYHLSLKISQTILSQNLSRQHFTLETIIRQLIIFGFSLNRICASSLCFNVFISMFSTYMQLTMLKESFVFLSSSKYGHFKHDFFSGTNIEEDIEVVAFPIFGFAKTTAVVV